MIYQLFQFFISITVITSGIIYLLKVTFNLYLNRNLESFKTKLLIEVEKTKKEIELQNKKTEVKFIKLHEERAATIKELYSRMVKVEMYLSSFLSYNDKNISLNGFNRSYIKQVTSDELHVVIGDFLQYFNINKIFFSDKIKQNISIINDSLNLIYLSLNNDELNSDDDVLKGIGVLLSKIIPQQRILIEGEFRSILGIAE